MGVCDTSSDVDKTKIDGKPLNPFRTNSSEATRYYSSTNASSHDKLILNNKVIVTETNQNLSNVYEKVKLLGKGAFGEVWLIRHKLLGKEFALKIIKKDPKLDTRKIENEIKILRKLDHPFILKIVEFTLLLNNYYIVTEYYPGGELFDIIEKKKRFTERETSYIIYQILLAVRYCHYMKIVHRDIKPENILIVGQENSGLLRVKLIDFGTAKVFSGSKNKHLVGSSYYVSPEVLKRQYDESCDLWSIGVIMYIMLVGFPPFNGIDDSEILRKVKIGKYKTTDPNYISLSDNAKDLISKLLEYNPKLRITAEQALKHPWFETEDIKNLDYLDDAIARNMMSNLERYKSDNIIRCAVLAYLVHQNMNIKPCQDASKLFNSLDTDHDGKLSKKDLINAYLRYYNLNEQQAINKAEYIFKNIDTDNNGMIENEEFIRACIDPNLFTSYNHIKVAFDYFDKNKKGAISLEDLESKFFQHSKPNPDDKVKLQNMFNQIDSNGDGLISFEDFSYMIKGIISN